MGDYAPYGVNGATTSEIQHRPFLTLENINEVEWVASNTNRRDFMGHSEARIIMGEDKKP
jgi:hypothetical protein